MEFIEDVKNTKNRNFIQYDRPVVTYKKGGSILGSVASCFRGDWKNNSTKK